MIEAGLGGRYDATNVIDSKVQVLTNVELEHTDLLGKTIPAILKEKAAVIPEKGNVVLGSHVRGGAQGGHEDLHCARRRRSASSARNSRCCKGSGDKFDVMTDKAHV